MKVAVVHRGRRYDVELSRDGAEVVARIGKTSYHVDVGSRTVDGRPLSGTLSLEILDERARLAALVQRASRARSASQEIIAPLPGLVTNVLVKAGQKVAKGAPLMTLAAMKLENEIQSPAEATVAKVHVRPGQPVEKGQALVSLT